MSNKSKTHSLLNGAHTAGIFADMSVDGPVVGTLVAIVDRAKNLPNRKTIGKQDPYCAARLGKEAKKTTTDIRGGQTPKWDQELRFTVHDSPDYYQLKVSVFTDDKKTDLIGEAWVDLKGIIVPGGGQSDMWQTLTCRGKYAGEIRIEITYYDARPKPDRQALRQRPSMTSEHDAAPARQRTPVKRRPLPSDPVTGEAPPPAPASPLPAEGPQQHRQTPPPPSHAKSASHSGFVASQSPLQAFEYQTPPPASRQYPDAHSPSPSTGRVEGPRARRPRGSFDAHTPPPHPPHDDRPHGHSAPVSPYDQPPLRRQTSPLPEHHHELPSDDAARQPVAPFDDGRPPPPPVHRSRHNSGGQELVYRGAYDTSPSKMTPSMHMRQDVLKSEAHRHSSPTYPGRPTFRPYDPTPATPSQAPSPRSYELSSPTRYHAHDGPAGQQYRSMQPTVEDVPESPPGPLANPFKYGGGGARRNAQTDDAMLETATNPSPGPLNPSRSPRGPPHPLSHSPGHYAASYPDHHAGQAPSVSPLSARDYSGSPAYPQYGGQGHRPSPRREFEPQHAHGYATPDVPASLSPGMDAVLSREVAEQVYEERRHDGHYAQRGRHNSEGAYSYANGSPHAYAHGGYDGRDGPTYAGGPDTQMVVRRRDASPNANVQRVMRRDASPNANAQRAIRRKSVSPAPPPPALASRRASDIPFGPDSYDALNPSMASPRGGPAGGGRINADDKIITHDGREIDPSDHLPMESWAPEPEPKGPKEPPAEPRSRPVPSGAQPMPPSGRRPLRIAARPHSTAALPAASPHGQGDDARAPPASASAAAGRSRLQKKVPRGSPAPAAATSSPLAPVTTDNYQDRQGQYAPTRHGGGAWDHGAGENQAPPHYASGPPIPAKIPLALMSGANGMDQALMEEMQRIDIGTGRSRRRGGY